MYVSGLTAFPLEKYSAPRRIVSQSHINHIFSCPSYRYSHTGAPWSSLIFKLLCHFQTHNWAVLPSLGSIPPITCNYMLPNQHGTQNSPIRPPFMCHDSSHSNGSLGFDTALLILQNAEQLPFPQSQRELRMLKTLWIRDCRAVTFQLLGMAGAQRVLTTFTL